MICVVEDVWITVAMAVVDWAVVVVVELEVEILY